MHVNAFSFRQSSSLMFSSGEQKYYIFRLSLVISYVQCGNVLCFYYYDYGELP